MAWPPRVKERASVSQSVAATTVAGTLPPEPATVGNPLDQRYTVGTTITDIHVPITLPTPRPAGVAYVVTVSGLPTGIQYVYEAAMNRVRIHGTISAQAAIGDYTVTVQVEDGRNDPVFSTFNMGVYRSGTSFTAG